MSLLCDIMGTLADSLLQPIQDAKSCYGFEFSPKIHQLVNQIEMYVTSILGLVLSTEPHSIRHLFKTLEDMSTILLHRGKSPTKLKNRCVEILLKLKHNLDESMLPFLVHFLVFVARSNILSDDWMIPFDRWIAIDVFLKGDHISRESIVHSTSICANEHLHLDRANCEASCCESQIFDSGGNWVPSGHSERLVNAT